MTSCDEPIQVIARFRDGRFEPMRFLWNGRRHRVEKVTGRWATRSGHYNVFRFALVDENDTYFEISLDSKDMAWRLNRVATE